MAEDLVGELRDIINSLASFEERNRYMCECHVYIQFQIQKLTAASNALNMSLDDEKLVSVLGDDDQEVLDKLQERTVSARNILDREIYILNIFQDYLEQQLQGTCFLNPLVID